MAGRIRQSDVDEVKARTNIADIIGEHVSLKSAGVGSMKGLCPFHDERSPSFNVRPGVGYYHCFGCGESGDVYSFLQKVDMVSFTEAVERLAARIGYELHYEDGGQAADHGNRARLLAANQAASEFFVEQLLQPAAEVGRRFLGERGFDAEAARRFGVGFAPKSWDALTNHLRGRGFSHEELAAAGLVSQGDRGVYDRFRGRLVWPIRDVTGQTVGFGARRLLDDDKGPKYLNTPETAIYHKAQVLYGLDLAKRDISKSQRVVVVEGYTDVMACHLAGVTTAIATCGTAFGVDHIKVLRRVLGDDSGVGEVIFTFDGDEAGQKAALRAFAEEQRFQAQTFVAVAPDGLDPCDLRLSRGDQAVRSLIETKLPMFEFVLRQTLARFDLDTVEGRVSGLRQAAPIVAEIRDPALRPGYTRELARMLGMDLNEVTRAVRAAGSRGRAGERGADARSGGERGSGERVTPAAGAAATVSDASERPFSIAELPRDMATRLERETLQVILQYFPAVDGELMRSALDTAFDDATLRVVRDGIVSQLGTTPGSLSVDRVAEEVPVSYASVVKQLSVLPMQERNESKVPGYARGLFATLVDRELLRQKAELTSRLMRLAADDKANYDLLQRAIVDIDRERVALRSE